MTRSRTHIPGEIKLADATPAQLRRLAGARQWLIAPDVLQSMQDPRTLERQKLQGVDRLVKPGSISIIVDPLLQRGMVLPRDLVLPPRYAAVHQALSPKEVRNRKIVAYAKLAAIIAGVLAVVIAVLVVVWLVVVWALVTF